jgi:hypothetical protein
MSGVRATIGIVSRAARTTAASIAHARRFSTQIDFAKTRQHTTEKKRKRKKRKIFLFLLPVFLALFNFSVKIR